MTERAREFPVRSGRAVELCRPSEPVATELDARRTARVIFTCRLAAALVWRLPDRPLECASVLSFGALKCLAEPIFADVLTCVALLETTTRPASRGGDCLAGAGRTALAALLPSVRRVETAIATRASPAMQPTSATSRIRRLFGAL